MSSDIYVTAPVTPPLDEFIPYLKEIWSSKRLANMGPMHKRLEAALTEYFKVKHVSLFCNGTIALQIGLQALRVTGEVITTPFSFPATTHAIYWNRCRPVFCDIDPVTLNIDPDLIESLVTPETTCVLPVHTYGTPCDVKAIQQIADLYGLKVFYDAAHVFGTQAAGTSLLGDGDLSMISFHATKVFNTIEGGALITNDPVIKKRIDYLKNFGFANEVTVVGPGGNGKMNEIQAAFGLCLLPHMESALAKRRMLARCYRERLQGMPGITVLREMEGLTRNWCYFPVFFDQAKCGFSRDALYNRLKSERIHARRYFYPLISNYPSYRDLPSAAKTRLPMANRISDQVLCLPMYPELTEEDVDRVVTIIKEG